MSTTKAQMFVYDVDPEGGCVVHYAAMHDEGCYVQCGSQVYPNSYFRTLEAMHQKSGHTLTMELDNEEGVLWSVRIGRGDFNMMLELVRQALEKRVMSGRFGNGYQN